MISCLQSKTGFMMQVEILWKIPAEMETIITKGTVVQISIDSETR